MFKLRQTADGWEVVGEGDVVLASFAGRADEDGAQRRAYSLAVQWLADNVPVAPVVEPVEGGPVAGEPPAGALSDRWAAAEQGICANAPTGDGRDFTPCVWTWRATVAPLPLMLLTETDFGHFGAEVCGWIDTQGDPTVAGGVSGWFHDSDAGRQARDILAAQGAYSVSVDPGAVEATFTCTEEEGDDWGTWCIDGVLTFNAYEIAGLTMVPFPGFGTAAITLESVAPAAPETEPVPIPPGSPDGQVTAAITVDEALHEQTNRPERPDGVLDLVGGRPIVLPTRSTVSAAVAVATRPPAAWFAFEEPEDDDPRYVQQDEAGRIGIPMQITDDGHVYAHAALWDTCHIGITGECVAPPVSGPDYAHYHLGVVRTAEGLDIATGPLYAGCDHAALRLRAPEATDWYAHNGVAWADVRASNGRHGIWLSGALRPNVTEEQVRVLRAGSLSGDWRDRGGKLEMIGALAASGLDFGEGVLGWHVDGRQTALVASGIVRPAETALEALVASGTVEACASCGKRLRTRHTAAQRPVGGDDRMMVAMLAKLDRIEAALSTLDYRTRPARREAASQLRERLTKAVGR
jgi:hypothetical protein